MRKGQLDRQPDERPAEQDAGRRDRNRPELGRKAPDLPGKDEDKAHRKPGEHSEEGAPIDKASPKPETRFGDKEIFEGERSDRMSGRPVQLEDEEETSQPGRADGEPGLGDRQEQGRQDRRLSEGQPTKR